MLPTNIKKHNEAYRNTQFLRNLNKPKHKSIQNRTRLEREKLAETFIKEIVRRVTKNLLDIQMLRLIQTQPMWGYKIKKHNRAYKTSCLLRKVNKAKHKPVQDRHR